MSTVAKCRLRVPCGTLVPGGPHPAQLARSGPTYERSAILPACANFRCGHEGPLRAHEPRKAAKRMGFFLGPAAISLEPMASSNGSIMSATPHSVHGRGY